MRRILVGSSIVVAVLAAVFVVRALEPSDVSVTLRDVPSVSVAGGFPNVLGLDLTIAASRGDALDALFVKQEGTAKVPFDLTGATLWADAGASGFQGIGVDRKLVTGAWNGEENGWAFRDLAESVSAHGTRFFVTVATHRYPTSGTTVWLTVPTFRDDFQPMTFDTGDRGVFLRTVRPAPLVALVNGARQTIRTQVTDIEPPIARITEPKAGGSFARDWLLIRGVAEDTGGSSVAKVRVGVNRLGRAITWVDATPEVTGFATWEARLFELPSPVTLELRVQAEDWIGNRSPVSEPIAVELK